MLALELRTRRAPRAGSARPASSSSSGVGEHELDGAALVELEVGGRDHDAHPAHAEDALDPVLAGEDVSHLDRRFFHRRTMASRDLRLSDYAAACQSRPRNRGAPGASGTMRGRTAPRRPHPPAPSPAARARGRQIERRNLCFSGPPRPRSGRGDGGEGRGGSARYASMPAVKPGSRP